jgi:hypothetical protein
VEIHQKVNFEGFKEYHALFDRKMYKENGVESRLIQLLDRCGRVGMGKGGLEE